MDFNFRGLILTAKFRENWTARKFPVLRYLIDNQFVGNKTKSARVTDFNRTKIDSILFYVTVAFQDQLFRNELIASHTVF